MTRGDAGVVIVCGLVLCLLFCNNTAASAGMWWRWQWWKYRHLHTQLTTCSCIIIQFPLCSLFSLMLSLDDLNIRSSSILFCFCLLLSDCVSQQICNAKYLLDLNSLVHGQGKQSESRIITTQESHKNYFLHK